MWPENWRALELFIALGTQWNRDAGGGLTGINYPSIPAMFDAYRIPVRQRACLFNDIRCIEIGALNAHLEKREKEQANGARV